MLSNEELKKIIVGLQMDLIRANIPRGHCPYTYYSTSKKSSCDYDNDIDCYECMRQFLKDKMEDIIEEVNKL